MNRHDELVGVVLTVCLARVVFAGGDNRPHKVFAIRAFADDDENVVHLGPALVEPRPALLDPRRDEAVGRAEIELCHRGLFRLVLSVHSQQ